MWNKVFSRSPYQLIWAFLFLFIAGLSTQSLREIQSERADVFHYKPLPMIEKFSFGYTDPMADFLWIRAIQDFDYCENKIDGEYCAAKGWLYSMLKAVTDLSPKIRFVYSLGATSLSVLVGDIEGARLIFEKGIAEYPKDWVIPYRASYHYLYEIKDQKRAAELLVMAGNNGGLPWFYALASRLYSEAGRREFAERLLQEVEQKDLPEEIVKKIRSRLQRLESSTEFK